MKSELVEIEKKALSFQNSGDMEGAIKLYKKLLSENPNYEFGIIFYHLACCQEEIDDLDNARKNYLKAIEYDPEDDIRWGGYASFLYLHDSPEKSLNAYLRLFKLERSRGLDTSNTIVGMKSLGEKIGLTDEDIKNMIND